MSNTTAERKRLIVRLIERDGDQCHYCGVHLEQNDRDIYKHNGVSIDHIVPQIAGGSSRIANLVLACRKCNREKMTAHYHEFAFAKHTDGVLRFLMDGDA